MAEGPLSRRASSERTKSVHFRRTIRRRRSSRGTGNRNPFSQLQQKTVIFSFQFNKGRIERKRAEETAAEQSTSAIAAASIIDRHDVNTRQRDLLGYRDKYLGIFKLSRMGKSIN